MSNSNEPPDDPSKERSSTESTEEDADDPIITTTDFDDVNIPGADPELTSKHDDEVIVTVEDFDDVDIPGADVQTGSPKSDGNSPIGIDQIKEDADCTDSVMTSDDSSQSASEVEESVPVTVEDESTENNDQESENTDLDTDFSGVSISGAEETNIESPEEGTAVIDTDEAPISDETEDNPFGDSDASETWGTTSSGDETTFSQTVDRESSTNNEVTIESETTSVELVPVDSSEQQEVDDGESPLSEAQSDPASVDTDFSGVDISGADPDTESSPDPTSTTEKSDETTSSSTEQRNTAGAASRSRGDNKAEETTSPEADVESDEEGETDTRRESVSATDVPTPGVEPTQRVRSPSEILLSPLSGVVETTKNMAIVSCALGLFILRGTLIVAEWATSIFLIFYGIFVGMALIFPQGAIPHNGGATTRIGVIAEVSIVVIPTAIAVFTISMLVDKWLNDGKRYKSVSEPVFNRL